MHWFPRYSVSFVGSEYVALANNAMFQISPPWTLGLWFLFDDVVAGTWGVFGARTVNAHWGFNIRHSDLWVNWDDSANNARLIRTDPNGPVSSGVWHFAAARMRLDSGNVVGEIFFDGGWTQTALSALSDWGTLNYGASFSIGRNNYWGPTLGSPKISGTFFCNQALSRDELIEIYRGVRSPAVASGVQGFWPFQEGAGTTVEDVVGGNNGTFSAGTLIWSPDTPDGWRKSA